MVFALSFGESMNYRFTRNLGIQDAEALNSAFACGIDHKQCTEGKVIDLGDKEANWLMQNRKGLLEPVENVKGVAKKAEITAPAKQ